MSATRRAALDTLVPRYAVQLPLDPGRHLVVEIGCGRGDATAAMAPGDAPALVIACEVNDAAVSHLAILLDRDGIDNVRIWVGDGLRLLDELGSGRVDELRTWFPDPWPKARHAQRRLVSPDRVAFLTDRLSIGGRWRFASDDAAYAAQALDALRAEPRLDVEVVERPHERPVTAFEAKGLAAGRAVTDIVAMRRR
jgi:tRNA (guanine-N7-)-methyltransferase